MLAYIVKRIFSGFIVLGLISLSVFLLFWYGPESPARPMCDRDTSSRCSPDRLAVYTETMGYNNPWYEEYGKYMKGLVAGREVTVAANTYECEAPCFGISSRNKQPVSDELLRRIPATISVAVGGAALYLLFGVPIGVAAARRRGTVQDKALVSSFLFLSSIPYYLFALLAWIYVVLVFEVPGLNQTGYFPITENPAEWFGGLALAWVALGIFGCTQYTRYSRGAMVDALSEDYIRTAKAKGLAPRKVVYKHGLRAALVPIVTIFGIDFGTLLAGTIFTEKIFDIDGVGLWALEAVALKDLSVVAATALFGGAILIVSNLLVDIVYGALDPRVRLS